MSISVANEADQRIERFVPWEEFEMFRQSAYNFARMSGMDDATALDVVQDATVQVLEKGDSVKDGRDFRGWFFTVVTNLIREHFRRTGKRADLRQNVVDVMYSNSSIDDPALKTVYQDMKTVVQRALELLGKRNSDQQAVMKLYHFEGLIAREIAEQTGMPLNTVLTHMSVGKRRLREIIQELVEDPDELFAH